MLVNIAITGASGAIYAKLLIERLTACENVESIRVIFSNNGYEVANSELGADWLLKSDKITVVENSNFYVSLASGSGDDDAMVIVPCSAGMLGRIASGISNDLISRGADVMLKERKKLIVLFRENPLNLIHIDNMRTITLAGGIVMVAAPSFYSMPSTIEDMCGTTVDVVMRHLGLEYNYHWK